MRAPSWRVLGWGALLAAAIAWAAFAVLFEAGTVRGGGSCASQIWRNPVTGRDELRGIVTDRCRASFGRREV